MLRQYLRDRRRQRRLAVIDVANRPYVYVRLRPIKLFLRHDFSLLPLPARREAISICPLRALKSRISVVRVNLQKSLPQLGRNLLDPSQVFLADKRLVADRERLVQLRRILAQQTFIQNLLKLPNSQPLVRYRSKEEVCAIDGKGCVNTLRQLLKALLILNRKNRLLKHPLSLPRPKHCKFKSLPSFTWQP
jgi:hypothetical protein